LARCSDTGQAPRGGDGTVEEGDPSAWVDSAERSGSERVGDVNCGSHQQCRRRGRKTRGTGLDDLAQTEEPCDHQRSTVGPCSGGPDNLGGHNEKSDAPGAPPHLDRSVLS